MGELLPGKEIVKIAQQALEDKKAVDIAVFDVKKISEITDFYVVASGMSPPHLKALSAEIHHVLKEKGLYCHRRAGDIESGWLIMDYVDVVVHLFMPEVRQYYAIEDLWGKTRLPDRARRKSSPKKASPRKAPQA